MSSDFRIRIRQATQLTAAMFPVTIPLSLLCLVTLILGITNLDIQLSSYFYDFQNEQWPLSDKNPWEFIDLWCVFPGLILGMVATIVSSYGIISKKWNPWTRGAFFLSVVFLIGPGLLVNCTMKPAFSRPRPREVTLIGGEKAYQPAFGFGDITDFNTSFPSGHASIGFFLIAPAFLIRKRHRTRVLLLLSGLLFGCIMSLSRVVQGGHYLSDVIWSLAIIYFTAWATLTLMISHELKQANHSSSSKKKKPQQKFSVNNIAA